MKRLVYISLLFFLSTSAQTPEGLNAIHSKATEKYVTPEALDRLIIELREFENSTGTNKTSDSIILDTYRSIAASYSANNHFRQSYEILSKYVEYKQNVLALSKASDIKKSVDDIFAREEKDKTEENNLREQSKELASGKDSLDQKQHSFKRIVSFILIILSSVFALMLVGAGIRLVNLRSKVRQNRDRLSKIHRMSNIGLFEPGLNKHMNNSLSTIKKNSAEIHSELKKIESNFSPAKAGIRIIEEIERMLSHK